MKRIAVFTAVLLVLVTLIVPAAQAGSPKLTSVEFTLAGNTEFVPDAIPIPPPKPVFYAIKGLLADGDVTGYFSGDFSYKENIVANSDMTQAATKGDMTIDAEGGTVKITFFGVDQLVWTGGPFPSVIVVNQPWVIKSGTGQYAGIKGGGVRNSFTGCGQEFCVKYTGKITLK